MNSADTASIDENNGVGADDGPRTGGGRWASSKSARLKIREGQLEGFKRQAAEIMRQAWEKDTGTAAHDWFLSTDGNECEVREAYVNADAFVEHTVHVREAWDTLFAKFAYDCKMTIYGEPSPRLVELVDRVGVNVTWFTLLQAHGGDIRIS